MCLQGSAFLQTQQNRWFEGSTHDEQVPSGNLKFVWLLEDLITEMHSSQWICALRGVAIRPLAQEWVSHRKGLCNEQVYAVAQACSPE